MDTMMKDIEWARINKDVLGSLESPRITFWIVLAVCSVLVMLGVAAEVYQYNNGLGVALMDRPHFWQLYISNFIFWIGMSHSGTLLSAVLLLTKADWRKPIYRFAEAMTLFAVAGALVGGGLFYAVGEAFYRLSGKKKEYLGFGDVMLMLMVGFYLGPPLTLMTVLLGSLGGTLFALPLTIASSRFRNYQWPYATFLGIAAIYTSLWGAALLNAYLRWAGFA